MDIQQTKLNNGLKVAYVHLDNSFSSTAQIWFKAGSSLEKPEDFGIAHFLEHMFFKGTPKRPGSAIAAEVESFGGEVNAFTSFDYTCYYINSPAKNLINSVEILMDMVSNPTFDNKELIPERDVVFEEYKRSQDNPGQFNFSKIIDNCFEGGYSHKILGTPETINSFTRDQVVNFRKENYNLSNTLLVVAGNLKNKEEISKVIEEYQIPEGPKSVFPEFILNSKGVAKAHHFDTQMASLSLCIQGPRLDDPQAPIEDLALNCFGHGETSPFYKKFVLAGALANSVSASTMFFSKGSSHFVRFSAPAKNLKKVYSEFLELLKEVSEEKFADTEVSKIKNQYLAMKIYEREALEEYAFALGYSYAQTGSIDGDKEYLERIKQASSRQIHHAFNNIFSRNVNATLQLPKEENLKTHQKDLDSFIKKLNSHTVVKNNTKKLKLKTSKQDNQAQIYTLKKGIELIYRYNPMTPTFNMQAYLKGGLAHENKNNNGQHSILSTLLTKGHQGYKYNDLRKELENKAASLNSFSGKNAYGLTLHGLSDHFSKLSDIFMGSFITPDIKAKFFNQERKLIERSLTNEKSDPIRCCLKAYNHAIFGKHHYALSASGSLKSIKSLDKDKLTRLHNKHLKNSKLVITLCGNIPYDEAIEKIGPWVDRLKERDDAKTILKPADKKYGSKEHIEFDRQQTQIVMGIPAYKLSDSKSIYTRMLTGHLSGQSSDLFVEVRDRKGLCYAVQPLNLSALEAGYWGIYIGTGNEKKDQAISTITDLLNKLGDKGVSKEEFENIKRMIHGQSQMALQTNEDYANIYSVPVLHNLGIDRHYEELEKIQKISYDDFNHFLGSFLHKEFNLVTAGSSS